MVYNIAIHSTLLAIIQVIAFKYNNNPHEMLFLLTWFGKNIIGLISWVFGGQICIILYQLVLDET